MWRGLPAGDYQVEVADNRGNRWHHEVVRFFGQDRYTIELDAVPLVGRIERGGEPLENVMVWFGGMWGFERVSFRSREEGRFSGLLPREGLTAKSTTPAASRSKRIPMALLEFGSSCLQAWSAVASYGGTS